MISLDGDGLLEKPARRRLRKVYYGYYDHECGAPYPVICIRGKRLRTFGFDVGDAIEVHFEHNHITIVKIEPHRERATRA